MAKVTFGSGVAGIRGRLGGSTFSFNNSGAYVKQWARPVSRASQVQLYRRQRLAQLPYLWNILAKGSKDDWITYAANPSEIDYDPWGTQRYLSGYQWYLRAQMRCWYFGEDSATHDPPTPAPTAIPDLTLSIETPVFGAATIDYTGDPCSAAEGIYADLAFATTPGHIYPQTGYRTVLASWDPGAGPLDISPFILVWWGDVPAGWFAFVRVWKQHTSGVRSVVASATTTVTAA
jgi:hypothetical protein